MQKTDLVAGALELSLAPAVGGGIARFDRRTRGGLTPILRRAPDAYDDVRQSAGYPLVPFSNRVRDGVFQFRGRTIRLSPNRASHPHPMHGQGWRGAWSLAHADDTSAEIVFSHPAGEWPWAYEARQHFDLTPEGLTWTLSCVNQSGEDMPCGLGLHPYFQDASPAFVDAEVRSVWTVDQAVLPVEALPAAGRYGLANRRIDRAGLDNGFDGWTGWVRLRWPQDDLEVRLTSAETSRLQVCSPAEGGFLAVEPVTHANAALNAPEPAWKALGLRVLPPGGEARLAMHLEVGGISQEDRRAPLAVA